MRIRSAARVAARLVVAALAGFAAAPARADLAPGDPAVVIGTRSLDAATFGRFVLAERGRSGGGAEALDALIHERLAELEARRRGVTITAEDVAARCTELERGLRAESGGKLGLADHIAGLRIERAEFEAVLRSAIACERMMTEDFGLKPGRPVPPEKQALWFRELRARHAVRTEGLPPDVAAEVAGRRISRHEWAMKLWKSLPAKEADKLFDEFVGIQQLLELGAAMKITLGPDQVAAEIAERDRKLREQLARSGGPVDGVDWLGTLKARGEDPAEVLQGDRFRAELLLKEITRRRYGADGWRAWYEQHRAELDPRFGRKVELATIFLRASQERSEKVPRTLREATDELTAIRQKVVAAGTGAADEYATQARLHSEHASGRQGGALGTLSARDLDQLGLPAALLDAAPGELAGPLVTRDGVHLLRVTGQAPAAPFEEIAPEVEREARRALLRELRKDVKIERRI